MKLQTDPAADYVIVGAGSAGAALAYRLSEDPDVSVTLLEAGGTHRKYLFTVPLLSALSLQKPRYDWCERSEPDPTRDGRRDNWPRGKVLGGSSSINGQIFVRGNRHDYDRWRDAGNAGWGWDDVLPYFRRLENNAAYDDEWHGRSGPVHVSSVRSQNPLADQFVAAAVAAGVPASGDLNGRRQEGVARNQVSQFEGRRDSTAWAYLEPAARRPNLRIVTGAAAQRILFDGRRASGVEYRRGGESRVLSARREVIVSASAIGSPKLLLLSGLGPAEALRELGVPVIHDLPGVGRNLQEHCGPWMSWEVRQPTFNRHNHPLGLARAALRWWRHRDGPMASPGCEAIAFVKSRPELADADAQIHFTAMGLDHVDEGYAIDRQDSVSLIPNLGNPAGRGELRLRSRDPQDAPLIYPQLLDGRDLPAFTALLRLCRTIMSSAPIRDAIVRELRPGPGVVSDDELVAYLRARAVPHFHPVGTCSMGSDAQAVVDARCRVHGVDGLRVVDASIAPTLVNANTNAMAIMIGERAADLIREDARQAAGVPAVTAPVHA
ncbi:MAG: GMC family oxidoreductase [Solimonas sp.]